MDTVVKAISAALVAVVLIVILSKNSKDIALVLTVSVCVMITMLAITNIAPVIEFVQRLEQINDINSEIVDILLKCVGISVIAEIAALICTDAGQAALGKALQLLGTAVVLYLSLPIFSSLLDLIEDIIHAI